MLRFLGAICGVILLLGCYTKPPTTPTASIKIDDLLRQEVQKNLATSIRPQYQDQLSFSPEETAQWNHYRQILATSLGELFFDDRAQSLTIQSLVDIFEESSNLSLTYFESPTSVVVSMQNVNPGGRTGGGSSPERPTDAVYIFNRQGDVWPLGLVGFVVDAVWAGDHWIILVAQTVLGGHIEYEVWHLPQWGARPTVVFAFDQLHSVPTPQLSTDGQIVTNYFPGLVDCDNTNITTTSCEIPDTTQNLTCQGLRARTYIWQNEANSYQEMCYSENS